MGALGLAAPGQQPRLAAHVVERLAARIEPDGGLEVVEASCEIPQARARLRAAGVEPGALRIQADRLVEGGEGLFPAAHAAQRLAAPAVDLGVARGQAPRFAETAQGGVVAPRVGFHLRGHDARPSLSRIRGGGGGGVLSGCRKIAQPAARLGAGEQAGRMAGSELERPLGVGQRLAEAAQHAARLRAQLPGLCRSAVADQELVEKSAGRRMVSHAAQLSRAREDRHRAQSNKMG